ncbi:MAG: oxygenase MpaB family protein [Solirubrobacterales bacterium]
MSASGDPATGYFAPAGVAWRVGRELALLLGGGRALLLQVAHPLVAAGVSDHSDYRRDPWKRLEGTMSAVWAIVFGSRPEADRAAARVRAMHSRVHGHTAAPMGPFPAGTPYSALDPALLMWVHATLVDTALVVHRGWVGSLSAGEEAAYYEEMKTAARLFGTPDEVMPANLGDFRAYMEEMLDSPDLSATDTARAIAAAVMHPPLPLALRPAMELANLVTAGLMPPRLRREYGLAWDPARAALVAASRETTRRLLMPLLPARLRTVPTARAKHRP